MDENVVMLPIAGPRGGGVKSKGGQGAGKPKTTANYSTPPLTSSAPSLASHFSAPSSTPSSSTSPVLLFPPSIDLVHELTHNRFHYMGGEQVSIYSVPGVVRWGLDRVRARVDSPSKISLSIAVCACVEHGVNALGSDGEVQSLLAVRRQFDLLDGVCAEEVVEVVPFFQAIPVSLPDSTGSGIVDKISVCLTEEVKHGLADLSNDMGVSASNLALLCIMWVLREQQGVLEGHRRAMGEAVGTFMRRVRMRYKVGEVLIGMLEGG
jgi:hypothetical protein